MIDEEFVDAIVHVVKRVVEEMNLDPTIYATWVSTESVDANLSQIRMADGTLHRGVPKLQQVTGLVAGDLILCLASKSKPMIILGKQVGNIRLYVA